MPSIRSLQHIPSFVACERVPKAKCALILRKPPLGAWIITQRGRRLESYDRSIVRFVASESGAAVLSLDEPELAYATQKVGELVHNPVPPIRVDTAC
jgi:hypothetical protein